jgi:hypothetical protein
MELAVSRADLVRGCLPHRGVSPGSRTVRFLLQSLPVTRFMTCARRKNSPRQACELVNRPEAETKSTDGALAGECWCGVCQIKRDAV